MKITSLYAFGILAFFSFNSQAQETLTFAGGTTTNSSGSISYSMGQNTYTTISNSNGSINQGVQQPFTDNTTLNNKEIILKKDLKVYPNPTYGQVTLTVESDLDHMRYEIFSVNGIKIKEALITDIDTKINVDDLPSTLYFLKVLKNNQPIQIFKIVKL